MAGKFKLEKFKRSDSIFGVIRYKVLCSGKIIAFGIAGTILTILQFGPDIDFDKESDELIDKRRDSKNHLAFEYVPNIGFDEVDINAQNWFIFN